MEVVIAVLIGAWLSMSAVIAHRYLKKEYKNIMEKESQ